MVGIEDLAVEHRYYCSSSSNYYSNEPYETFDTFYDFLGDYGDMDVEYIDMNLVFRWDIKLIETPLKRKIYQMEIFMIQKRKGIFKPILIKEVTDHDVEQIIEFLNPHKEYLTALWKPL